MARGQAANIRRSRLPAEAPAGGRTPPTVRDKTSYASAATETSAAVPIPTNAQAGDVHYIFCELTAATGAITTPTGYTAVVPQFDSESSTSAESACFRKDTALSGGGGSVTISFTSGRFAAASLAIAGVDTGTFEDVAGASDNGPAAGTTSVDAPSVTPANAGTLLLTGHTGRTNTDITNSFTKPSGMTTEEVDVGTNVAAASNASVEVCSLAVNDTNATGLQTATASATVNAGGMSVLVRGLETGGAEQKTLADSATGSDTLQVDAAATLADAGAGSDALSVAAAVTLADSGTGTDSVAVALAITLADQGAASDTLQVAAAVSLADSGSSADSLSVAAAVTLTDQGTGADSLQVAIPKDLADQGAAADQLTATAAVSLADSGAAADSLSVAAAVTLTQTGTGTDTVSVLSAEPKTLTDSGSSTQTLTVAAQVALADSGTTRDLYGDLYSDVYGTEEQLQVAAAVTLPQPGSAADTFSVVQGRTLTDTGTAGDVLRPAAAIPLGELGVAAESLAAAVLLALTQAGIGTDTFDVQTVVPVFWAVGVATTQPAATGTATAQPQTTGDATLQLAAVGEGSQQ